MSPAREFPGRSHLPHEGAVCGELQRLLYYQPPTLGSQRPGKQPRRLLRFASGFNYDGRLGKTPRANSSLAVASRCYSGTRSCCPCGVADQYSRSSTSELSNAGAVIRPKDFRRFSPVRHQRRKRPRGRPLGQMSTPHSVLATSGCSHAAFRQRSQRSFGKSTNVRVARLRRTL
jgi:hypothetical protein